MLEQNCITTLKFVKSMIIVGVTVFAVCMLFQKRLWYLRSDLMAHIDRYKSRMETKAEQRKILFKQELAEFIKNCRNS